jgi:hypothetical protein
VIMRDEFTEDPAKMAFSKRDDPIETFLFDRAYESLLSLLKSSCQGAWGLASRSSIFCQYGRTQATTPIASRSTATEARPNGLKRQATTLPRLVEKNRGCTADK